MAGRETFFFGSPELKGALKGDSPCSIILNKDGGPHPCKKSLALYPVKCRKPGLLNFSLRDPGAVLIFSPLFLVLKQISCMRIRIICMGKVREPYLADGISEYLKRLRIFTHLEVLDLPDEKVPDRASDAEIRKLTEKEGLRMLNSINPADSVVALDVAGTGWSSEDLAEHIGEWELSVRGDVIFLIGGSLGLSDAVIRRADIRLSLSRMTFTHQMVRLILLEQIYRAFMIRTGRPYHR